MTNPRGIDVRRAFTIIEMMIAVAAIALLSVGISAVFRTTGDVVRSGRRLSVLNTYAALLERQMRDDFNAITRDGFMYIRHDFAGADTTTSIQTPRPVALSRDDVNPRLRRADQIVFFATGDFVTRRAPVHPDRIARSDAARIYYGHGQPKDPAVSLADYLTVEIDDDIGGPQLGTPGPSLFAKDWILMRFVTLLCQPIPGVRDDLSPDPTPPGLPRQEQPDNEFQISLQPAASSLFRRTWAAGSVPALPPDALLVRDELPKRPRFGSGAVDVATTDLSEVRAAVLGSSLLTGGAANSFAHDPRPWDPDDMVQTERMQWWMEDALPVDSDRSFVTGPNAPGVHRMRCEPAPPDLFGWLGGADHTGNFDYRRADQSMLTAFNLAPHCTEFIVEWSFGELTPRSQVGPDEVRRLVWYGLERRIDVDNNGSFTNAADTVAAAPYGLDQFNDLQALDAADYYKLPFTRLDGTRVTDPDEMFPVFPVTMHGEFWPAEGPVSSYFGYIDPSYHPEDANKDENEDDGDSNEVNGFQNPPFMPWAWPKLVRITMTLTDPNDPLNEQTFQFVFEVPDRGSN